MTFITALQAPDPSRCTSRALMAPRLQEQPCVLFCIDQLCVATCQWEFLQVVIDQNQSPSHIAAKLNC